MANKGLERAEAIIKQYEEAEAKRTEEVQDDVQQTTETLESAIPENDVIPVEQPIVEEPVVEPQIPESNAYDQRMAELEERFSKLEQSKRVLEGKYNAEVPRLAQDNAQLKSENAKLQNELQELHASYEREKRAKLDAKSLVGEDLIDVVDEDTITVAERIAKGIVQREMEEFYAKIQPQLQSTTSSVEDMRQEAMQREKDMYERSLRQAISGFDSFVSTPEFCQYLKDNLWLQTFRDADANRDVDMMKRICDRYKSDTAPKEPVQRPNPKMQSLAPKQTVAQQKAQPEVKRFRLSDMKRASDALMRGKMSDAQFDKFNKEFEMAYSQGLVEIDVT